jgi:hypothetical protein
MVNRNPGIITEMLVSGAPNFMACFGRISGCVMCIGFRTTVDMGQSIVEPMSCVTACSSGIHTNCGAAAAKFLQTYWDSQSVLCGQLFQTGKLDASSYQLESRLGNHLLLTDPFALNGYQTIAKPIVKLMQISDRFETFVDHYVVRPFIIQTDKLEGNEHQTLSYIGYYLHHYGIIVCRFIGRVCHWF